jgi:hypothetical protein
MTDSTLASSLADRLGKFFANDLCLATRGQPLSQSELAAAAAASADFAEIQDALRLVYTAFDGDHQELTGLMRRYVLARGGVPVNPDNVLGYKETIEARYNKAEVLRDDLSVLRGCDELWVFSDHAPSAAGVSQLAEGVLVEIVFFLKRHPRRPVCFVNLSKLLHGDLQEPLPLEADLSEIADALRSTSKEGVFDIANGGVLGEERIPPLCYFVIDPLDFKYCRFLREQGYDLHPNKKTAPIVPNLAVEADDCGAGISAVGRVVTCWAKLMRVAAECWIYPPMEAERSASRVATFLERVWLRDGRGIPVSRGIWANLNIPKARLLDGWPVTQYEKRRLRERK